MIVGMPTPASSSACSVLACQLQDVLPLIFGYLNPDPAAWKEFDMTGRSRRDRRKALVSAATSCRVLSYHALDMLWRELDDIENLFKVLPEYQCIEGKFILCGAISPEHWSRLLGYAKRVRSATACESTGEIQPSVWLFLAARLQGSLLLPCVRELHVHGPWIPETPFLAFLLSPTLRIFDVCFRFEDEEENRIRAGHFQTSILQILLDVVPDLEHFTYRSGFDPSVVQEFLQPLTQFKRLKSLTMPHDMALDQHVVQTFLSVTTLETLSCDIHLSGSSTLVLPSHAFLRLRDLDLRSHSDHLLILFRACTFPTLVRVKLKVTHALSISDSRDLFIALCEHCDRTLIKHLDVDFTHSFVARPGPLMEYIEPLMVLPNIRYFRIWFKSTQPSLCDADIVRIAAAWPRLTRLLIRHTAPESPQPGPDIAAPSLSALVELARRCPSLMHLTFPELDPGVVPELNGDISPRHGLRSLVIRSVRAPLSAHQVYLDTATVLDRIFPSMSLKFSLFGASPKWKSWTQILRLLNDIRAARTNGATGAV